MKTLTESTLYEPVRTWFEACLAQRFRRSNVRAYDTSSTKLSKLIAHLGLQAHFPQSAVWDIKADVTALIMGRKNHVAFVECKAKRITLRDVGQLLGYSRVAKPVVSMLLSPQPPTDALRTLLSVYGRYDILEYDTRGRRILITQWDCRRGGVLHANTLPPGEHI